MSISENQGSTLELTQQNLTSLHTFALQGLGEANSYQITEAAQLPALFAKLKEQQWIVLGEGSNTIFIEDYLGIVVINGIKQITCIEAEDSYKLTIGAGFNWHALVEWTLAEGIKGLENLALIPGSVGAAPVQNIGAYGIELNKYCVGVHYFDINTYKFAYADAKQCKFGYRDSVFKHELKNQAIITQVELVIPKQWQPEVSYGPLQQLENATAEEIFQQVIAIRQSKLPDPAVNGNAGSFFKNPVISTEQFAQLKQQHPTIPGFDVGNAQTKVPAAWFIDQLGFKGRQVGDVQCNPHQPLVLMNLGKGEPQQLVQLAKQIQTAVMDSYAVKLQPEVRLIGKSGEITLDAIDG